MPSSQSAAPSSSSLLLSPFQGKKKEFLKMAENGQPQIQSWLQPAPRQNEPGRHCWIHCPRKEWTSTLEICLWAPLMNSLILKAQSWPARRCWKRRIALQNITFKQAKDWVVKNCEDTGLSLKYPRSSANVCRSILLESYLNSIFNWSAV